MVYHFGVPMLAVLVLFACAGPAPAPEAAPPPPEPVTLTLAGYAIAAESYEQEILPAFQREWLESELQEVSFERTFQASGAQARAIRDGMEADVAALSLETDIVVLEEAKLVTRDWRSGPHGGVVSRSVVVLAVRPGNPRGIDGWEDLAQPGLAVLTPNVRTSGGAMWNALAVYGAALRGKVPGVPAGDTAAAEAFLADVLRNVRVMDATGRESMLTFESGVGDVAITYENEVLVAKRAGKAVDYVVPPSTILIENPAVVVDVYAKEHGTLEVADAFVAFLHGPEAQAAYVKHGLRPADPAAPTDLPTVADLFTVRDLGGWSGVKESLFAAGAGYDRALAQANPKP